MSQDTINITDGFFETPIFQFIIIPLLLMVIGWILKALYDKYFNIRPKLYLKLGKELYARKFLDFNQGHEHTWTYHAELKNISSFDAYNIKIVEDERKQKILNNININRVFPKNNHLEHNKAIKFDIDKTIKTEPEILLRTEIKDGKKSFLHGLKIQNPGKALLPEDFKKFELKIIYFNERGKKFRVRFLKDGEREIHKKCKF